MATNKIYPFCPTVGADNLFDDATYLAAPGRVNGNQPGIADDRLDNKALRQATLLATVIAQFIADNQGTNVDDSLSVGSLEAMLIAALVGNGFAKTGVVNTFTDQQVISKVSAPAQLNLVNSDPTPTNGDILGDLISYGNNSALAAKSFASLASQIVSVTAGSEDGGFAFRRMLVGTFANAFYLRHGFFADGLTDPGVGGINATDVQINNVSITSNLSKIYPRQNVMQGPYNNDGSPNLGGSTGSGTVTTTGIGSGANTFIAASAQGRGSLGNIDLIGLTTGQLSFTVPNVTATVYAYVDVAGGAVTPHVGTLAPVYTRDFSLSATNGQWSYNISDGQGYVGNGSSVSASSRVYVGEFDVVAGAVTAIRWYPYRRNWDAYQKLQDVSGSRALTTTYKNNTALPITVEVTVGVAAGNVVTLLKNGSNVQNWGNNSPVTTSMSISTVVQPGDTYAFNAAGSFTWFETR